MPLPHMNCRRPRPATSRAGFSMLEVMLVMIVMTLAISMLAGTISSTAKMGPLQIENAIATEAARKNLEFMRIHELTEVFARFNADPADDPDGAGTAPGQNFQVEGLSPRAGDADGMCGRIRFPGDGIDLREDVNDGQLGMPRDLNLDGVVETVDVSDSYVILPVEVRIEWRAEGFNASTSCTPSS